MLNEVVLFLGGMSPLEKYEVYGSTEVTTTLTSTSSRLFSEVFVRFSALLLDIFGIPVEVEEPQRYSIWDAEVVFWS